jgi:hypothetical protein
MRNLIINVIVFIAVLEGLGRLDFLALVAALALGFAAVVCTHLLFTNLSSRAQ